MTVTDLPTDSGRDDASGLYWEAVGDGPPVLLIGGIGMDAGAWWRTIPILARSFRVITFDPRGLGRSAPAPFMCTTSDLAADSVAVMDAAGADAAHVYGFSLGGMVAQRLALRHPERVRRLVLGSFLAAAGPLAHFNYDNSKNNSGNSNAAEWYPEYDAAIALGAGRAMRR